MKNYNELNEKAAEMIYNLVVSVVSQYGWQQPTPWEPGGNSIVQDDCRRTASDVLQLRRREPMRVLPDCPITLEMAQEIQEVDDWGISAEDEALIDNFMKEARNDVEAETIAEEDDLTKLRRLESECEVLRLQIAEQWPPWVYDMSYDDASKEYRLYKYSYIGPSEGPSEEPECADYGDGEEVLDVTREEATDGADLTTLLDGEIRKVRALEQEMTDRRKAIEKLRRDILGVPLEDVKRLREITGASIKACREALEANEGDIDQAVQALWRQGEA